MWCFIVWLVCWVGLGGSIYWSTTPAGIAFQADMDAEKAARDRAARSAKDAERAARDARWEREAREYSAAKAAADFANSPECKYRRFLPGKADRLLYERWCPK